MKEAENKRAGIIGTVIFHLLLLLFFMTNGLTQPDPLPEQEAASIMLGWVDAGATSEPTSSVQDVPQPTPSEPEPTAAEPVVEQEVATQEESSVAVNKPEETKPTVTKPTPTPKPTPEKPKEEPKPEKPSENLQNALDDIWNNSDAGQGDNNKPGNEGKPEGTPKGKGVFGGGGNGWSLSGRSYEGGAIVTEKPKEEGIIVIEIIVGIDGTVLEAHRTVEGSNSVSPHLINLALKAARNARFNRDPSAGVRQKGTLTFNFKLK